MKLRPYLQGSAVKMFLRSGNPVDAIRELAGSLRGHDHILSFDDFVEAVVQREPKGNSSVVKGIWLSRACTPAVDDIVIAVGRLHSPLFYAGPDQLPVNTLILAGVPAAGIGELQEVSSHLIRLVERRGFVEGLMSADGVQEVLDLFGWHERQITD